MKPLQGWISENEGYYLKLIEYKIMLLSEINESWWVLYEAKRAWRMERHVRLLTRRKTLPSMVTGEVVNTGRKFSYQGGKQYRQSIWWGGGRICGHGQKAWDDLLGGRAVLKSLAWQRAIWLRSEGGACEYTLALTAGHTHLCWRSLLSSIFRSGQSPLHWTV